MGILHFLDVAQGDCSIIEHPLGRVTMIDVCKARLVKPAAASPYAPLPNSVAAALGLLGSTTPQQALSPAARDLLNALLPPPPDYVNPIEYMRARNISALFRYIQSHPEADHMDGIADLCDEFPPANFWDTDNTCDKTGGFGFGGYRREDWDYYLSIRNGTRIVRPTSFGATCGRPRPFLERGDNAGRSARRPARAGANSWPDSRGQQERRLQRLQLRHPVVDTGWPRPVLR